MAQLTGNLVADTFKSLLKTVDNDVLSAYGKEIVDGYGNSSNILINTSGDVTINGNFRALDAILDSSGSAGTNGQVLVTTGLKTEWQSLSAVSGVSGTGTAGYITKWLDANTITNSIIIESGTTVTIGGTAVASTRLNTPLLQLTGGTGTQGEMSWNTDEETVDVVLNGSTLQLGQEVHVHVRNNSVTTAIPNGTPVYVTGTLGASGRLKVAPMIADGTISAEYFIGVTTEEIGANEDGKVTWFGKVRGFDTSGYTEGSKLYVSETVAGGWQTTEPTAPNPKLEVAFTVNQKSNGTIFVRGGNGQYLHNNHDVSITSVADKDLLVYDSTNGIWQNSKTLGAITTGDITISDGVGSGTISYDNGQNAFDLSKGIKLNAGVGSFNNHIFSVGDPLYLTSQSGFEPMYLGASRVESTYFRAGNGFQLGTSTVIDLNKNASLNDATLTGVLKGPSTFYIDPLPIDTYGDATVDTGKVVILGDLEVTGTTTTVNSTVVDIADLNLTLASNATTASEANGAGITIGGASATLTYASATDDFTFNKDLTIVRPISANGIYYPLSLEATDVGNLLNQEQGDGIGIQFKLANNETAGGSFLGGAIAAVRENASDADSSTSLEFYTSNNDEILDKKLTILSNGTVSATTFSGNLTGNASTASKWATARTITIGDTGKSVDGSGNVSWSKSEIGFDLQDVTDNGATTTNDVTVSRLRVTAVNDASATSTLHGLQVGSTTSTNIIMDGNELMARDNGVVSGLNFNPDGGDITIHNNTTAGTFTIGGETIWHSGNDGSGTGLDADTVDTKHASDFTLQYITDNSASTTNALSINSDTFTEFRSATDNNDVGLRFSSMTAGTQYGDFKFNHVNTQSYGALASFVLSSSESDLAILADGKLLYKTGIYVKPATGTGAGTLFVDSSRNITANDGTFGGNITSTGYIRAGSGTGSAASPQLQIGDNDSGFFDSGANEIGVALGGTLEYEFLPTALDLKTNALQIGGVDVITTSKDFVGRNGTFSSNVDLNGNLDVQGKVGIGTTSPSERLTIVGDANKAKLELIVTSTTGESQIHFGDSADVNSGRIAYNHASDYMSFYTNNIGDRMIINSSGNVGIGTTSPSYKLDVAGEIGIDSYIRHNGDSDTYFGFNAIDSFKVRTGNADRLFVNNTATYVGGTLAVTGSGNSYFSNSNVGIGTTSPSSLLSVGGVFTATTKKPTAAIVDMANGGSLGIRGLSPVLAFDITSSGTPKILMDSGGIEFKSGTLDNEGTVNLKIDTSGNVGIGTTSPSVKLHVEANSNVARFTSSINSVPVSFYTTGNSVSTIGFKGSTSTNDYNVRCGADANDYVAYTNNTERMRIDSSGNVLVNTTSNSAFTNTGAADTALFKVQGSVGYVSINDSGNYLEFSRNSANYLYTSGSSSSLQIGTAGATAITVNSSQNVGIGTTSPSVKLDIKGTGTYEGISIDNTGTTGGGYVRVRQDGFTRGLFGVSGAIEGNTTSDVGIFAETGKNIRFYTNGSASEKMRIDSSGRLLVGKTTSATSYMTIQGKEGVGAIHSASNKAIYLFNNGTTIKLDAYDYDTSSALNVQLGGNGGNVVIPTGNVGIGTTSPSAKLHLSSIESVDLRIDADTDNAGSEDHNPRLVLTQDGGGIESLFGINGNTDAQFTGAIANGAYWKTNASIQFLTNNTISATIDTNNRIGIGNFNDPQTLLELRGSSPYLTISNTAETDAGIYFNDYQAGANPASSSQAAAIKWSSGDNILRFYNNDANALRMAIDTAGDIFCYNNLNVTNTVTANAFSGDGSALTGISTGAISSLSIDKIYTLSSISHTGYMKFMDGLLIQWGSFSTSSDSGVIVNFPTTFNIIFNVQCSGAASESISAVSTSSFVHNRLNQVDGTKTVYWMAIGYTNIATV